MPRHMSANEDSAPEPPSALDIQDYLDAAGDASRRTRTITVALVVASVIMMCALLNSLHSSWMLSRIHQFGTPGSEYVTLKMGQRPASPLEAQRYDQSCQAFAEALAKAYVDQSLLVHIPFFGPSIDVNDLGVLGGVALIVILALYRFALSRESENLRLSFAEAERMNRLRDMYYLLAMRQVLTVPQTDFIRRDQFLRVVPKLVCWFPAIIFIAVFLHDLNTSTILNQLGTPSEDFFSDARKTFLIASELIIAGIILVMSNMAMTRLTRIDEIWDNEWKKVTDRFK
jgi:hypothetical protein